MWITKNNLRPHINQFIHEEQTTLEHFLMNQHAPLCLGCHHEEHAQQVGRQSRPRSIGYCQDGTVYKILYHVMLLTGNIQIILPLLNTDTQLPEGIRNNSQLGDRRILNRDFRASQSSQPDITSHLDHVGQTTMLTPAEAFHALDSQQIRSDPRNPGPHGIQHTTQLLHVRFTGRVIYRCHPFRQHGCHDNISRTRHGSLVK